MDWTLVLGFGIPALSSAMAFSALRVEVKHLREDLSRQSELWGRVGLVERVQSVHAEKFDDFERRCEMRHAALGKANQ